MFIKLLTTDLILLMNDKLLLPKTPKTTEPNNSNKLLNKLRSYILIYFVYMEYIFTLIFFKLNRGLIKIIVCLFKFQWIQLNGPGATDPSSIIFVYGISCIQSSVPGCNVLELYHTAFFFTEGLKSTQEIGSLWFDPMVWICIWSCVWEV